MADWIKEKAGEIQNKINRWRRDSQGGYPVEGSPGEFIAQALREAEARGMERAAKLVGGFRKITYPEALNATEVGAHNAFVTRLQKAIQEDAGTEGAE